MIISIGRCVASVWGHRRISGRAIFLSQKRPTEKTSILMDHHYRCCGFDFFIRIFLKIDDGKKNPWEKACETKTSTDF